MKPLHNKLKTCVVVMNEMNGGFKKHLARNNMQRRHLSCPPILNQFFNKNL
jgi:hypothetical protein